MKTEEPVIPHREIRRDESELLEQLWKSLPEGDTAEEESGFRDVQGRIRRQGRRRNIFRLTAASGIAAMIAVAFGLWRYPAAEPVNGVLAQIEEMEAAAQQNQVILTDGSGLNMTLDSMAYIEQDEEGRVDLRTKEGKSLALAAERMLQITVPEGRQFRLTLADGSDVWLNADTRFEYPASFAGKAERRVRLEGEAFFEVKKDSRPFYVEVGAAENIRVLGTSFNVNAYADAPHHVTTLVTGKVSYLAGSGQKEVVLLPNQQVEMECATGKACVREVDATEYALWKEGIVWFEEERLADLAVRLKRLYGIPVEVAEHLADVPFSGKIRYERGIEHIVSLLRKFKDLQCVVEEGVIRLK